MSYNSKNFSVMAYANGFTLWSYSTADALTVVRAAGYFKEIAPFARPGDMILVTAKNTAVIEPAILSVATVTPTAVTISGIAPNSAAI